MCAFTRTRFPGQCEKQCDQIGQFIGLWATFQNLWQQLFLTKSYTFLGNFCTGVKIFNFSSEIIFGATFIDIWRVFTGHTVGKVVLNLALGLVTSCLSKTELNYVDLHVVG